MDPLTSLLRRLHLATRLFHRERHCGEWTLTAEYEPKAMFHLVAKGRCDLILPGNVPPRQLEQGDVVLFPRPADHVLRSAPPSRRSVDTILLCGYFDFASPLAQVVLGLLPATLILRHREQATGGAGALLRLIMAESDGEAPGRDVLVDKLADALFVYVLRRAVAHGTGRAGLLRGLEDERLGPLLLELHERSAEPWTLARMATAVHLSRAAFVRRFQAVVGMPPAHYLAAWRMHQALSGLTEQGMTVTAAAQRAGYITEAAFSRAFKRHFGYPPSAARRHAVSQKPSTR